MKYCFMTLCGQKYIHNLLQIVLVDCPRFVKYYGDGLLHMHKLSVTDDYRFNIETFVDQYVILQKK